MKRQLLAQWLALGCALAALSCNDTLRPDATGSIAIQVVIPPEPVFGGSARSPAQIAGHLTSATATAVPATGSPTTVNLTGGTASSSFTGTISNLAVGSYTVIVQGFVGTAVDYYGQQTAVSVTANTTSTANVIFQSFVPTVAPFTSATTWSFRPAVNITAVPNATGYVVEADRSNTFPSPSKVNTSSGAAWFAASDTGTWYVRVRATNATVTSGGNASGTQSMRVVTDLRPSGADFSTATSLGFFGAVTNLTLDSLNIAPAGEADWFALSECNGDSVTITAQAVRLSPPSPLNSVLGVFNNTGRLVAFNDNGDSTDARVRMLLTSDGIYKVAVTGANNTEGHYKLNLQIKTGANNTGSACKLQPLPGVTSLGAGLYHSCSVRAGGVVDCWGWNSNGQLGVSPTSVGFSSSPVRVSGSQTFSSVVVGGYHTCGLDSTGKAYCWGYNYNGQVGDGTTTDRSVPTAVSQSTLVFVSLTAGDYFTCGRTNANTAYCWGGNGAGQLGNGTTTSSSTPVLVTGGYTYLSLQAGARHVCGLPVTGGMVCWGLNDHGQLGNNSTTNSSSPVVVNQAGGGIAAQTAAVGGFHSCGLVASGAAYCWGRNTWGALGNGATADTVSAPVAVTGALVFSSLTAGRYSTCGITNTAATYCWGDNFDGEVGDGTTANRSAPTAVTGGITYQTLSMGGFHTCGAQASTGNVYCWGWNGFGQVGDGSAMDWTGPVPVTASTMGTGVTAITTGHEHTCALGSTGAAFCWGWNDYGQVGDASTTSRTTPVAVSGGLLFKSIYGGTYHTCGLTTANSAYCWGDNYYGELGNGTNVNSSSPVQIGTLPSGSWTALVTGDLHSCALNTSGAAYCWGNNADGEFGNGTKTGSNLPTPVSGGLTFKQITGGSYFTCAVTTSGAGYCWGDNTGGELGTGNNTAALTPVGVSGSLTWASISAGSDFACGLTTTGSIYCWGDNANGQLGIGSYTSNNAPALVSGGLTWKALSVSRNDNACGITTGNVLYCWGDNFTGRLGNGTFIQSNVPTVVMVATGFQVVSSGDVHTCGTGMGGVAYCWGNNERGELGYGTTTLYVAPKAVVYGPATAPSGTASFLVPTPGFAPAIPEPDRSGAAGRTLKRPVRGRGGPGLRF